MLKLDVKVRMQELKREELPEASVYVFDRTGRLLSFVPLKGGETSEAKLELPGHLAGAMVRVLVAPRTTEEDITAELPAWAPQVLNESAVVPPSSLYETLKRRGAAERRVRVLERGGIADLVVVKPDWQKWLQCSCLVRGRLVKRVPMPDGTHEAWGVSHACVQIWEVDSWPLVFARLPDDILHRVRRSLLDLLKPRPPEPPLRRWPPPPPDDLPHVLEASLTEAIPSGSVASGTDVSEVPASTTISASLESIVLARSAIQLRQALMSQAASVVHMLCHEAWLMGHFTKHLLKCTCTDDEGYFQTTIWYPCIGDHPDLYFSAGQCISGHWHVLYDPGMACHVYWNYPCGTDVTLETADVQARVCAPPIPFDPPPGVLKWVMPYMVGNILIPNIKASGLVDHSYEIPCVDAPWGAWLGLRVGQAAAIPTPQLYYYRWQYQVPGSLAWHDLTTPLADTIVRTYVDYDLTPPLKPPTFPAYVLGPKSVKSMALYEFRPHDPPAPAPGHHTEWPGGEFAGEIYSAAVDSRSFDTDTKPGLGLYHFKLEVYDNAGNLVTPGPGTFEFIVPIPGTTDSRLALPGEMDGAGFVFGLYVDNRACEAYIDTPTAGGTGANPNCGFLFFQPTDSVTLGFEALHPGNRATFAYWVRRGANVLIKAGGEVATILAPITLADGTPTAYDFTGDTNGSFSEGFAPAFLLGPCPQAAFAEILRVHAKATNGWDRLRQYDAGTEWAFALAPKPAS